MKKLLFIASLVLLLFTSISAIFGGLSLMKDPTGGIIHMPLENLQYSPFKDFLIPGIILFVFNGLLSLAIFIYTLFRYKHYALLVVFQGCILLIWIVVQLIMLRSYHYLHAIYGGIGLILILLGVMMFRMSRAAS